VVTSLLKEMNESVAGSYVETAPEALVEADPEFIDRFDLVVATQVGGSWGWGRELGCRVSARARGCLVGPWRCLGCASPAAAPHRLWGLIVNGLWG
jgi:hypothetical protein